MTDAHARRHEREVVKRLLSPSQEGVALKVALDLFSMLRVYESAEAE